MIYSTKQDDHITCTLHNCAVYPTHSKGVDYWICNADGKGHFLASPEGDWDKGADSAFNNGDEEKHYPDEDAYKLT